MLKKYRQAQKLNSNKLSPLHQLINHAIELTIPLN
jgi:hypothetical protein